jgi:predicted phage-related endonuclease
MGLSPYSSPFALFHQKTGDLDGAPDNDRLALGRYLEQFVADRFAAARPEFYVGGEHARNSLFAHPDRLWQLATPDRLLYDWEPDEITGLGFARPPLAVLECKTAASYEGWGEDGTDVVPVHYRCQVLWQMDVVGVTTGFVACLFLPGGQLRVYELTLDDRAEDDLTLMRLEAISFLGRIETGDPPDVDWRPASTDALKRLHPSVTDVDVTIPKGMGRAYQAACSRHKTAEQRKQLMENRVRERLGTGHRAVTPDGQPIARRDVYDLAEKTITRKAATVDRLVAVKPKEKP